MLTKMIKEFMQDTKGIAPRGSVGDDIKQSYQYT